jgi:hypothetical protein
LTERWLRHAQFLGGPSEMQLLRQRDKVPQRPEIHHR